ncbi:MAG TPA: DUF5946 family protein [Candidatus Limnocylindria bacterium]|nr:DUF5946 family protein [Candidatus Limnocylindria bacterium]
MQRPKTNVAAVVLAAGRSRRFGSPKQLARLGAGMTMLDAVVRSADRAGLEPIIAVLPPGVPAPSGTFGVENDRPEEGLSRSVRLGIAALPQHVQAAIILLGDQPTVGPDRLAGLVGARGARPVVASMDERGLLAPPVLLERAAFALVETLSGDSGLRELLGERAELVEPVIVTAHAPDVDTPADLAIRIQRCPGCGGIFATAPDVPAHAYIGASTGCWRAYTELLAREYGDARFGRVHRHTVDVYAAQHPGTDGRRQRQSVALHLIAICHWLEHGLGPIELTPHTQRLAHAAADWPWLTPPTEYEMDVRDVLAARDGEEHAQLVRAWAVSVWAAWSAHHAIVRRWAADALREG